MSKLLGTTGGTGEPTDSRYAWPCSITDCAQILTADFETAWTVGRVLWHSYNAYPPSGIPAAKPRRQERLVGGLEMRAGPAGKQGLASPFGRVSRPFKATGSSVSLIACKVSEAAFRVDCLPWSRALRQEPENAAKLAPAGRADAARTVPMRPDAPVRVLRSRVWCLRHIQKGRKRTR